MDKLAQRTSSYDLFSSLFLKLPDERFINNIRNLSIGDEADDVTGCLKEFINASKDKSDAELLEEIAVDRTYLLRGLTQNGPRPPYESLYAGNTPHETIGGLNLFYARTGNAVSTDVHEPGDYIGVEMSFMRELCAQEALAADRNDENAAAQSRALQKEFFNDHLGRFGLEFAKEIIRFAKTGFYQGIGHILAGFMEEEKTEFT